MDSPLDWLRIAAGLATGMTLRLTVSLLMTAGAVDENVPTGFTCISTASRRHSGEELQNTQDTIDLEVMLPRQQHSLQISSIF